MKRIVILLLLACSLTGSVLADDSEDPKLRLSEIDKALGLAEQRIRIFSSNAVRYAQLIEAEKVKVRALLEERQKLMPAVEAGNKDSVQEQRLKLARDLEGSMLSALQDFLFISNGQPAAASKSAEGARFRKLQNSYLTLMMDYMLSDANQSQSERVGEIGSQASKEQLAAETSALDTVDALKSGVDDYSATVARSNAEGHYRFARLKREAAAMASLTLAKGNDDTALKRIETLVQEIAGSDPNNFVAPNDGRAKATHKWFREMKRGVDLEEFRRMAAHAPIFDDGKLVSGNTRLEIAYLSELALADRVKRRASTMPISALFWPTDTRIDLAKEIEAEARNNADHLIFAYLQTGVEPSPRMYMMAVMRTLRYEQEKINTWLVEAYDKPWYDTGLGTVFRASDGLFTGEAGFTEVQRRIEVYMRDVDHVHNSFKRAIETEDPEDLGQDDQDLLIAFGYVERDVNGSLLYAVPKKSNIAGLTASAQRGLKLPGAPVLDVINPKNVAITVVTTLVPGYAATVVEGMALRAGAGMRTIFMAKIATEVGVGAAFDAVNQYAETGKIDAESLLIESVLLGGLIERAEKYTMGASSEFAERLVKYKNSSVLADLMKDDALRESATKFVSTTLGLASENAITLFYESQYKGTEIDQHTFFTNLVNSSLTRSISGLNRAIGDGEFMSKEQFVESLPEWLRSYAKKDPNLANEVFSLSREQAKLQDEAMGRYREAVGEGDPTADRLFSALLKGEISWMDLTIAYQGDTAGMEALMHSVKDLRDNFFDKIKLDAVRLAQSELKAELSAAIDAINAGEGGQAEKKALVDQAFEQYLHDFRYMSEQIISPGSKSPVSDIDRSMQHPRLRRLMVDMFNVQARAQNEGTFIPTSARAFDVNEYYNVMPFISKTNQMRRQLDPIALAGGQTHGEVMRSFGFAAAMMHMNGPQIYYYKQSERKKLDADLSEAGIERNSPKYIEAVSKFELQMNQARENLDQGRTEMLNKISELGLDTSDPNTEIRARSALYQDRMDLYYQKLKKLDTFSGSESDKQALHAQIERDMAYMLREGIETYSGSATLDIIVVQMQIADLSMDKALTDPSFTLAGSLQNLSPEHIDFMARDQSLMMVEHINGYFHGHELPYNSGKALAKYAQRGLLALKIKGDIDLKALTESGDMSNPTLRLHTMTARLMEKKANPEGFNEVLSGFTPEGNPDAGLKELMQVIEQVLPGMEKQSLVDNFEHLNEIEVTATATNPFRTHKYFRAHRYLEQREERAIASQIEAYGGGALLEAYYQSRLAQDREFLAEIQSRFGLFEEVGRSYERRDWPEVMRLKKAIHGLELVSRNVPGQPAPEWGKRITMPLQKMNQRLQELELPQKYKSNLKGSSDFGRLWMQMQHLLIGIEELETEIARAQELKRKEEAFRGMDLTGVWSFERGALRGRAKIEQTGEALKIWLSSETMTAKPPHFYLESTLERGRLSGRWEELHSPIIKSDTAHGPAKNWGNTGIFRAEASPDRSVITLSSDTTELLRHDNSGWRWGGLQLFPAKDGETAPTNLRMLSVTHSSVAQVEPYDSKPSKPREGKGNLWVSQFKANGSEAHSGYKVYLAGTYDTANEDLIAQGLTSRTTELAPGSYEMVREQGGSVSRQPFSIAAGQVTTFSLQALGQVRLKMSDSNGKEFIDDRFKLRLLQGQKGVGWCGDSPTSLGEGRYTAVIYFGEGPIGLSSDYKKELQVSSKQATLVELRYGGYQYDVNDVDGKPYGDRAWLTFAFKNPDGSSGIVQGDKAGTPVNLLPGNYTMSYRLSNGCELKSDISVVPGELRKGAVQLGQAKLLIDGKPTQAGQDFYMTITAKSAALKGAVALNDLQNIDLFPGSYEGEVFSVSKGRSQKVTFEVRPGRTNTLKFIMKKD